MIRASGFPPEPGSQHQTAGGSVLPLYVNLIQGAVHTGLENVHQVGVQHGLGAMAVVGAVQDGIYGNYSILAAKAVLDLIIILVMTKGLHLLRSWSA